MEDEDLAQAVSLCTDSSRDILGFCPIPPRQNRPSLRYFFAFSNAPYSKQYAN
jgi:hypothetical protein